MMCEIESAMEYANAIRRCVLDYQYGFSNEDALHKLTRLVNQICLVVPLARYEAERLLDWAKVLYSPRGCDKYPGGADQVHAFVLEDCQRLSDKLEQILNRHRRHASCW